MADVLPVDEDVGVFGEEVFLSLPDGVDVGGTHVLKGLVGGFPRGGRPVAVGVGFGFALRQCDGGLDFVGAFLPDAFDFFFGDPAELAELAGGDVEAVFRGVGILEFLRDVGCVVVFAVAAHAEGVGEYPLGPSPRRAASMACFMVFRVAMKSVPSVSCTAMP